MGTATIEETARFVTDEPTPVETEVGVMRTISAAFETLDSQAQRRVLEWAQSRYRTNEIAMSAVMPLITHTFKAIAAHADATRQPHSADRLLWETTLKGTKFEKNIPTVPA